ncbi:MAG: hypothetical protein M1819_004868 [Sarea resinae]|nr:MAG: hypothetical protein M1819_004868 [Sarea resinae]
MADIQQWRRRTRPPISRASSGIPPMSPRNEINSPPGEHMGSISNLLHSTPHHQIPGQSTAIPSSPRFQRPASRTRLSHYLTSRHSSTSLATSDHSASVDWFVKRKDDVYRPDPELMMQTVCTRILSQPNECLPPEYNSFVLHVMEAYRMLRGELVEVQERLDASRGRQEVDMGDFERAAAAWREERGELGREIRRLEGLVVRKGNVFRREGKGWKEMAVEVEGEEKIGETEKEERLLKISETKDKAPSYRPPPSPSYQMTLLSHRLSTLNSADDVETPLNYSIGAPPPPTTKAGFATLSDPFSPPSSSSRFPDQPDRPTTSLSEDTFSSGGDPLPDEEEEIVAAAAAAAVRSRTGQNASVVWPSSDDFDIAQKVAGWLARRRSLDTSDVYREISKLFFGKEDRRATFEMAPSNRGYGKAVQSASSSPLKRSFSSSADGRDVTSPIFSNSSTSSSEAGEAAAALSAADYSHTAFSADDIDMTPRNTNANANATTNVPVAPSPLLAQPVTSRKQRFSFLPGDDAAPSLFVAADAEARSPSVSALTARHAGSRPRTKTTAYEKEKEKRKGEAETRERGEQGKKHKGITALLLPTTRTSSADPATTVSTSGSPTTTITTAAATTAAAAASSSAANPGTSLGFGLSSSSSYPSPSASPSYSSSPSAYASVSASPLGVLRRDASGSSRSASTAIRQNSGRSVVGAGVGFSVPVPATGASASMNANVTLMTKRDRDREADRESDAMVGDLGLGLGLGLLQGQGQGQVGGSTNATSGTSGMSGGGAAGRRLADDAAAIAAVRAARGSGAGAE